MAIANTELDLLMMDTHSLKTLAIGDASTYKTGMNIQQPSIQITVPGYSPLTMSFVAGGIQVYNSYSLNICSETLECNQPALPDGIYTFKYTITPANVYNVTKQFFRMEQIYSDLDYAFLKLEIMECDGRIKKQSKETINNIQYYLSGAAASANQCALKQATELYNKARNLLDKFIDNIDCNC